jgi:hypothetical protein
MVALGHPSLATAALIAWEWLQREEDIFASFDVRHYRAKERPNAVRVLHVKTREENWIPLFDDVGVPLYPELMGELDALKRDRIGGLMLCRDWGERLPWPTARGDLDLMRHNVKHVIRSATSSRSRRSGTAASPRRLMLISPTPRSGRRGGTSRRRCCRATPNAPCGKSPRARGSGARCEQKQTVCQNEPQHACQNDGIET